MSSTSNTKTEATKVSPDQCEAIKKRDAQDVAKTNIGALQLAPDAPDAKRPKLGAKPEDISKYVTEDLWSEDPGIVRDALKNLVELTADEQDGEEHIKTICSLGGHMMVLAALKKHIDVKKVIVGAIFALYNIIGEDSSLLEALVSGGAIEVILKAIKNHKEHMGTVESGLDLLADLIGDSWENALFFNNAEFLDDIEHRAYGLIAQIMKDFPIGCPCGDEGPECKNGPNRVHMNALGLLKRICHHQDLRCNVFVSGCGVEIMKVLEHCSTPAPIKSIMEWETLALLKKLAATYDANDSKVYRMVRNEEASAACGDEQETESADREMQEAS